MNKINLTYKEAIMHMAGGNKIKLPEWDGHWYMDDGKIMVFTGDGRTLDTPYENDYVNRTDWMVTDGSRTFGGALKLLKAGLPVARKGWNGKGMYILLQVPDINSKMNRPYIYMECPKGSTKQFGDTPNEFDRVPWLASQTDILAEDWELY